MEESDGERPVPLHGIGPLLFHSLGALGGLVVRTVSAVPLVVMIVIMGLASGAMMPLEFLPSWVRTLSHVLLPTYLLDAALVADGCR